MALPTPYPDLNAVLYQLVESIQAALGDIFVGAYLQGSFAVGDFDPDSDVDWIAVIERELYGPEVDALQALHERIYRLDSAWAQHLEGSYFPAGLLRRLTGRGPPLWYLDNGSRALIQSTHDNTAVVRSVLHENGVVLAGPAPPTLVDPVPVADLRREMWGVLDGWGRQILADPQIINNRFYQGFAVLSYCRMLHDLHTGTCGSKRAGSEWAKAALDPNWAGLIDRAWDTRPRPEITSRQPADPRELAGTLDFIRYVLHLAAPFAAT